MVDRLRIPGSWRLPMAAWLVAVVGYGLVLTVVELVGLRRFDQWQLGQIQRALASGDLKAATMWSANAEVAMVVPWTDIAAFVGVGACVLAVAWAGYRWVALSLPVLLAVITFGPTVDWYGAQPQHLVAHPIGEGGGYSLWSALVAVPASQNVTMPAWPYHVGSVVQLVGLLVPVLLTPQVRAASSWRHVLGVASIPIAVAAFLGLATAASIAGYADLSPAVLAIIVVLLAGLISSGRRGVAARVGAVVLPAVLGAAMYPLLSHVTFGSAGDLPPWAWLVVSALTVGWFAAFGHLRDAAPIPAQLPASESSTGMVSSG